MPTSRPTRARLLSASVLTLLLAVLVSIAPPAVADTNPDPGSAGGLPCSARMSMSKTGNTIELIARMACNKPKFFYGLDVVMHRTGAGPNTSRQWDLQCRDWDLIRSCRKVMHFKDIRGKQTYRVLWGGGTHYATNADEPHPRNYCKWGADSPGTIHCVNYTDTRF